MSYVPPDLREFVDLTLYDRSPAELVERAVADAEVKLPGWIPREGLTEMVLLEAWSLIIAELVFAVNRLPGAVAEGILALQGVPRDQGAAPVAQLTVTFVDDAGRSVPAGTRLRLPVDSELGFGLVFTVDAEIVAPPGELEAAGTATAATLTAAYNGTAAGSPLDLLEQNYYVAEIVLAVDLAGGRDVEDTAAWLTRATQRLARLVDTLLLPDHFVAAALEEPGVERAFVADLYDPGGAGVPGDDPGHTTLAVMGPDGVALTGPAKTALYDRLRPLTADHLELHVVDATIEPVNVTVTVVVVEGWAPATVEANVAAALREYLSPSTWPWANTVYRNELISLVDQVPGVERVTVLAVPAADEPLAGVAPLADAGVIIVAAE